MLQRSLRPARLLASCSAARSPRASTFNVGARTRLQWARSSLHTSSRLSFPTTAEEKAGAQQSGDPPLPASDPPPPAPSNAVEDPLKKKVEAQEREIIDLKDKYLRSVADFRNLQERTKRDVGSARDFAISKFAKDLIDSVDNLDRALSTVPAEALRTGDGSTAEPNKDLVNLHDGLKMTERVMMQTLAKHGLERYDPTEKEERFDPNLHEASFMAPMQGKEDGAVFTTIQKGFVLNGRVIRAAKVGIVKNT